MNAGLYEKRKEEKGGGANEEKGMTTAEKFEQKLLQIFEVAQEEGEESVIIVSGDLHRKVGGYPGRNHSMPNCCYVMRRMMRKEGEILSEPYSGQGATLKIQYRLPRDK